MRFVLDASITIARVMKDEANARADRVFDRLRQDEALAPAIWPLEVANALIVAVRKGRLAPADLVETRQALLVLPVRIGGSPLSDALGSVLDEAARHGLSAYDASYLVLAMQEGLPLATGDGPLRRAAEAAGVQLLD